MLTLVLAWVQTQSMHGIAISGDEARTLMLGALTTMGGVGLRLIWTMRDDVRDMKREVPEIKHIIELHEKEIRWLTGKRIAQEAIEEAERQSYQGPDKRRRLRRDKDIVNDAFARTDEHQYPEDDP